MIKYLSGLKSVKVDGAIAFTIFARLIQAMGGVVSILFIARFLTSEEQGYYYTFASIIAIQVFFELGLTTIITQYTAHEFAHLAFSGTKLCGDEYYKSRVSSILHFCVKWFGVVSLILFILLVIVGFVFFNKYNSNVKIDWQQPWIILCLSTALNLFIDPVLSFFDGLNEVKDMAKVRLVQKTVQVILLFVLLSLHAKLYALAISNLVAILVNYVQILFSKRFVILKEIWISKGSWVINYIKEIFPFQWRIAVSWISGYFIFQTFNPVLFATEGAKTAGQMGMTLQVLNGITALSMSWITTKVPTFSALIARKEFIQLKSFFKETLKSMIIVATAFLLVFNGGVFLLGHLKFSYATRFLPLWATLILSICCLVSQITSSWATYLRCAKKEPFLVLSIVMAVLCSLSVLLLGKYWGLTGVVTGYGFLTIFISFIWANIIYKKKSNEWYGN